jgi:catechol 2,3-dioxygenase-like lactoylglutathione lyase family enzyme
MSARHAVSLAVPFFHVSDMKASLQFYVEGLGFVLKNRWTPDGHLRWCWLELDKVALMLQQFWRDDGPASPPDGPLGQGVSICLMCEDALAIYRDLRERGIGASRPFVGNGLWVTTVIDRDGYRLDFESPASEPEETVYSD